MGKLTFEVFTESCCDGDSSSPNDMSARSCGCDPGANWLCTRHQVEEEIRRAQSEVQQTDRED